MTLTLDRRAGGTFRPSVIRTSVSRSKATFDRPANAASSCSLQARAELGKDLPLERMVGG